MRTSIQSCPFCGGNAAPRARRVRFSGCPGVVEVYVECKSCRAKGPAFNDFRNDDSVSAMSEKAINAWNERVAPPMEEIEKIKEQTIKLMNDEFVVREVKKLVDAAGGTEDDL